MIIARLNLFQGKSSAILTTRRKRKIRRRSVRPVKLRKNLSSARPGRRLRPKCSFSNKSKTQRS